MDLRITLFEDQPDQHEEFRALFNSHAAQILTFDLNIHNNDLDQRLEQIAQFNPHFIVVDLVKQSGESTEERPGYRIIRKLQQAPTTNRFPIIAYSILLTADIAGQKEIKDVTEYGAKPLLKTKNIEGKLHTPVERFFEAAGIAGIERSVEGEEE